MNSYFCATLKSVKGWRGKDESDGADEDKGEVRGALQFSYAQVFREFSEYFSYFWDVGQPFLGSTFILQNCQDSKKERCSAVQLCPSFPGN